MVTPEKIKALARKFKMLNIREQDIVEKFTKAKGPGGQKVNKTSSCVWLKHLPTGIAVKCRQSRSQALNRFLARRTLANKIEEMLSGKEAEIQKKIYKIRKQKRKRTKRAKEKILKIKKIISEKKKLRRKTSLYE